MEKSEIADQLKILIEEDTQKPIESHDQILDLDSYTMMLTITFVKDKLGIELDMDTLDFDAFTSLNTLAELVQDKAKTVSADA
jgi:acyl carrier protein